MPCALNSSSRSSSFWLSFSCKRRGRLVEDQQAHLLGQRLGDLDQLLLADAERVDQRGRAHRSGRPWPAGPRSAGRSRGQLMTPPCGDLVAEEEVLGDRQQRHQRQFLVDDDDAALLAVVDAAEARRARRRRGSRPRSCRADRRPTAPSSAWTCRRRSRRPARGSRRPSTVRFTWSSALTPGKVLVIARISRMRAHVAVACLPSLGKAQARRPKGRAAGRGGSVRSGYCRSGPWCSSRNRSGSPRSSLVDRHAAPAGRTARP